MASVNCAVMGRFRHSALRDCNRASGIHGQMCLEALDLWRLLRPRNPPLDRSYFVKTEVAPVPVRGVWAIGLEDRPRPQMRIPAKPNSIPGCARTGLSLIHI